MTEDEGITISFASDEPILMNPTEDSSFYLFIGLDLVVDDEKVILSFFIKYSSTYFKLLAACSSLLIFSYVTLIFIHPAIGAGSSWLFSLLRFVFILKNFVLWLGIPQKFFTNNKYPLL